MVLITVSSKNAKAAAEFMPGLIPAFMSKIRGEYRFQKLYRQGEISAEELTRLSNLNIAGIKVDIDVDPVQML
jgi:primosomal protein N'